MLQLQPCSVMLSLCALHPDTVETCSLRTHLIVCSTAICPKFVHMRCSDVGGCLLCSRLSEQDQRIALGQMMLQSLYDDRERAARLGVPAHSPHHTSDPPHDPLSAMVSIPEHDEQRPDAPRQDLPAWHSRSTDAWQPGSGLHARRSRGLFHPPFHWAEQPAVSEQSHSRDSWQVLTLHHSI